MKLFLEKWRKVMYRINLVKAHRYLSDEEQYKTVYDLTLAHLIVLEQIANGHKLMTEIRHNTGMEDYTLTKAVNRLSEGYWVKNSKGKAYKIEGLQLLSKHKDPDDPRYKFMSFTNKGLEVRDAIMNYFVKKIENKNDIDDVVDKRHFRNEVRKMKRLIQRFEEH